jgi:hypothetical protein
MMRFLKIAVPVFIFGFVLGNAFWYLASPLWIDREVSEALVGQAALTPVAAGDFRDADSVHRGSGKAEIFARGDGSAILRLTEFQVTNGPDLEVWLVAEPNPEKSADVKNSTWLALGQLKGNIGDQNYEIPAGTDLTGYGSVVIWCEMFGVLFSPATLSPVG